MTAEAAAVAVETVAMISIVDGMGIENIRWSRLMTRRLEGCGGGIAAVSVVVGNSTV